MVADTRQTLEKLLHSFSTAMLVTRSVDGTLRSRPMAIARVDQTDDVWFVTDIESGKVDEIDSDPVVNVALQNGSQYVSLSGTAAIIQDRMLLEEMWQEAWRVWFPKGKDDPNISLLRVRTTEGEYWDNSGQQGLKYLFEAGKAYLTGTRPAIDEDVHQKVDLR